MHHPTRQWPDITNTNFKFQGGGNYLEFAFYEMIEKEVFLELSSAEEHLQSKGKATSPHTSQKKR